MWLTIKIENFINYEYELFFEDVRCKSHIMYIGEFILFEGFTFFTEVDNHYIPSNTILTLSCIT